MRTLIRSASRCSLAAGLLFAFSALAQTKGPATEAPRPSHSYVIGPGDVLQIIVAKEPEASAPVVVVRSDGMISLPLLKEVSAAGLTPRELEKLITQSLSKLIRDADVTVLVKEIHSEKIYMIGALRREGPIVMAGPMTVLQAISEAGGFTDYAKRSRIYVLRQDHGKQMRYPFDYNAVIRGDHPEENITLQPGDSVVVPQ
jgi:polysaccharide export outer membrane protein